MILQHHHHSTRSGHPQERISIRRILEEDDAQIPRATVILNLDEDDFRIPRRDWEYLMGHVVDL